MPFSRPADPRPAAIDAPPQGELFDLPIPPRPAAPALPPGMVLQEDFLGAAEEQALVVLIATLPLEAARYKGYVARRRTVSYGGSFDYDTNRLQPGVPLISALEPLRGRAAAWLGVAPDALVHALVAEYAPATPLGWHRDVPDFEDVVGISLGTPAVLRLRPWPPERPRRADVVRLTLPPRSIYRLQGPARWAWQHSVAPTPGLRWSITFRTAARR